MKVIKYLNAIKVLTTVRFIVLVVLIFNTQYTKGAEYDTISQVLRPDSVGNFATSVNGTDKVNILLKKAGWFSDAIGWVGDRIQDAWDIITLNKKFGHFSLPGKNAQGPYTLFDRSSNKTVQEQLMELRNWIKTDAKAQELYFDIYTQAITGGTGTGGCQNTGICASSSTAKCAAFVYVVGLAANKINEDYIIGDSTAQAIGQHRSQDFRDVFYEKAMSILNDIENPWRGGTLESFLDNDYVFVLTGGASSSYSWILSSVTGLIDFNYMQYRSKEAIMFLQAFDILKWSSKIDPYLEEPNRDRIFEKAYIIKDNLIVPMHKRAKKLQYYANNNYTLMAAAALGMASIVLNDYGGWIISYNEHPNEWAHQANYNIHNTMWSSWYGPMSTPGKEQGYAEGPHYFKYAFQNLLPYFKTYQNFVPFDFGKSYASGVISPFYHYVRNYNYDPDYDNLYTWYNKISNSDGIAPPTDDSYIMPACNGIFAITGKPKFSSNLPKSALGLGAAGSMDLRADYLAALPKPKPLSQSNIDILHKSAVIIRDNNLITGDQHYLYINTKGENAIAPRPFGIWSTHEHNDAGSFIIGAKSATSNFEYLMIDAPMKHTDDANLVDEDFHHNTISITRDLGFGMTDNGPDYDSEVIVEESTWESPDKSYSRTKISYTFSGTYVTRQFEVFKNPTINGYYYLITDYVNNWDNGQKSYTLNLHGNGNGTESSFLTEFQNKKLKWFHPCNDRTSWGVLAEVSSDDSLATFDTGETHEHGNDNHASSGSIICQKITTDDKKYGHHNRLKITSSSKSNIGFITKITPYRCENEPALKYTQMRMQPSYNSQLVITSMADSTQTFHFSRNGIKAIDSIINPFTWSVNDTILTDAADGFVSIAKDSFTNGGYCISNTTFRTISLRNGKILTLYSAPYVNSNFSIPFLYYQLLDKYKYGGTCKTGNNATTVNFFLPDLAQGIVMVAKGNISSYSYDTNTFMMSVVFPANTTTNFRFEMADPCKINCFYPDTNTHITDTFVQAARDEYMPYKLKILQPSGQLIMSGGAKMQICEFKWLHNKDSLVMSGDESPIEGLPPACEKNVLATKALSLDNKRTAIIVGNNASLVLDSGSYTRVGANSSIYVLPGGTLIVKPYAILEIGSNDAEGYGEVLADRDAYVCVSPNATIKFYKNEYDSSDKNRFYVYVKEFSQPQSLKKTEPSIPNAIEQMLYNDTLISAPGTNNCQPFCSFNNILPPYGIINRDWGYAPFVYPKATFKVAGDTLCPGDSVIINMRKVLNEAGYRYSVCRVQDTALNTPCMLGDTNAILEDYISIADGCTERKLIPDQLKFLLWDSGWYRIKVEVINECGIMHDTTKYVYVPAPPNIVINIPDSICPGVGTLIADGSQTQSNQTRSIYKWTVVLVLPDSIRMQDKGIDYGGDWGEFDSTAVGSQFNFPDFRFYGGFKYAIGLSVKGWCGWVTKWDTVDVPLATYIKSRLVTNYLNPIGPSAFELKGFVTGATSYSWNPTTYLDEPDSLTTIARPNQPITYVLQATNGLCYDYDTMTVSHNEIAYAGENALLCYNEKQILGTGYSAFNMLALIAYFNKTDFDDLYPDAFKPTQYYFNRFMLDNVNSFYFRKFADDTTLQRYLLSHTHIADVMQLCFENNYDANAFSSITNTMIQQDAWLLAHLTANSYSQLSNDVASIIYDFANWLQTNVTGYPTTISTRAKLPTPKAPAASEIVWEKSEDNIWLESYAYKNSFNIVQTSVKGGDFRITVLNPTTNTVEYDQVSVIKDTNIQVAFMPSFITDSTVWFTNLSSPVTNRTTYNWYFGDGAYANLKHPSHTFPAMDSSYIICLTATNECDSFTFCDTLTLDSNGMYFSFGKKSNTPPTIQQNETMQQQASSSVLANESNYFMMNKPNPFSDKTYIGFGLAEDGNDAEIRITNMLGQRIKTVKLKGNSGYILIDAQNWNAGMYYYTLLVNGTVIESKVMILDK